MHGEVERLVESEDDAALGHREGLERDVEGRRVHGSFALRPLVHGRTRTVQHGVEVDGSTRRVHHRVGLDVAVRAADHEPVAAPFNGVDLRTRPGHDAARSRDVPHCVDQLLPTVVEVHDTVHHRLQQLRDSRASVETHRGRRSTSTPD